MSADNGIYILKTPARPIKNDNCYINQRGIFEYRVAYVMGIENISYSDLYLAVYFANSEVYTSRSDAMKAAVGISLTHDYLEYGISDLFVDRFFPNLSAETAQKALDTYVGSVPV